MLRELLWACRWLGRNRLFTAVVTVTLALGIGANTAVFSVVDAVLLKPLPYRTPDRLVAIEETNVKKGVSVFWASDFERWRSRTDLFERIAAYRTDTITLTGIDTPDQVMAMRVTGSLFPMLGVRARLGRALIEADDQAGAPESAVLCDRLWRRLFHADPGIIGKPLKIAGEVYAVVGVMPPEFEFPHAGAEMWLPMRLPPDPKANVGAVIAQLRPGIPQTQANNAMAVVARQLEQEDPDQRAGLRIQSLPWTQTVGKEYRLTLLFILAAAGLLLLIACANIGSLMLSRAVERQREMAIRASMGAGFWRVMRQLLAESLVVSVIGSLAGVLVAWASLGYLARWVAALPFVLPRLHQVAITGRVLAFNAALCLLAACVFSIVPAAVSRRLDLQTTLRRGRGATGGKGPVRLFSTLIASEAAFGFLLLAGSGLMIRSLIRIQQGDHGFLPDHVLTMRVPIGTFSQQRPAGLDTKPKQMAYLHDLVERLERVPGIKAVGAVNNLPLSGYNTTLAVGLRMPGVPAIESVRGRTVSPQYFAAMGIPVLAGRPFLETDQATAPPVVILNEQLAHQLFPNQSAVGQTITEGGKVSTVVGVVKNSSQMSYVQAPEAEMYLPYQQFIFGAFLATIVARTEGDPRALAGALQKEVWAVNRDQPIVKIETMNEVINASIWRPRFSAWLLSVISGLALLLMSAGVYGVIAYTANLRAWEVGIRMALGAAPRNVVTLILRDALVPVVAGLALSAIAALLLHRLLASLLYGISGADPLTYVTAGAALLAVGTAASAGPAWRAAKADPVRALRSE